MKQFITLILIGLLLIACKKENTKPLNSENTEAMPMEEIEEVPEKEVLTEIKKQSVASLKEELTTKGFQIFDYVDEQTQDKIIMQRYYIAFLKSGPIRNQNEEEAAQLQEEHLAHLSKMYELGYADISGPFDDEGDIRGITIYNVPTKAMADSLANADPAVKAGRLEIEIHPWWAAKGFGLR